MSFLREEPFSNAYVAVAELVFPPKSNRGEHEGSRVLPSPP